MDELYTEKSMGPDTAQTRDVPAELRYKPQGRAAAVARPLLNSLIAGGVIALAVFVFSARPDLLRAVDMFGITYDKSYEKRRTQAIMELRIPYEKKLALVDKKIFIGATSAMVPLALGNPQKVEVTSAPGVTPKQEVWSYQLEGHDYITLLEFSNQLLVKASKAPAPAATTPQ